MRLSLKALAVAFGLTWGGLVLLVGICNLIFLNYGGDFLRLLASIYPGYEAQPTVGGVIVATLYALVDGLISGLVFG